MTKWRCFCHVKSARGLKRQRALKAWWKPPQLSKLSIITSHYLINKGYKLKMPSKYITMIKKGGVLRCKKANDSSRSTAGMFLWPMCLTPLCFFTEEVCTLHTLFKSHMVTCYHMIIIAWNESREGFFFSLQNEDYIARAII